jgi:hypothetical protein
MISTPLTNEQVWMLTDDQRQDLQKDLIEDHMPKCEQNMPECEQHRTKLARMDEPDLIKLPDLVKRHDLVKRSENLMHKC